MFKETGIAKARLEIFGDTSIQTRLVQNSQMLQFVISNFHTWKQMPAMYGNRVNIMVGKMNIHRYCCHWLLCWLH